MCSVGGHPGMWSGTTDVCVCVCVCVGLCREEDSGLQDILEKIEEVLEASQGLESVAVRLWELTTLATRDRNQVNMHQASQLTFTCLVCRGMRPQGSDVSTSQFTTHLKG